MTALGQGLQVICLKGDDRGTFCYCVIRCIDNGSVYLYPLELSKFTVTPDCKRSVGILRLGTVCAIDDTVYRIWRNLPG